MLKLYGRDSLEVGFDVSSDYHNYGIGTKIMSMLLKKIKVRFPGKRIIARVYSDNDKSQHIVKTLGGRKIGEELSEYEATLTIIKQLDEKNIKKCQVIRKCLAEIILILPTSGFLMKRRSGSPSMRQKTLIRKPSHLPGQTPTRPSTMQSLQTQTTLPTASTAISL